MADFMHYAVGLQEALEELTIAEIGEIDQETIAELTALCARLDQVITINRDQG